jgi:hypothetical protein
METFLDLLEEAYLILSYASENIPDFIDYVSKTFIDDELNIILNRLGCIIDISGE